MGNFDAKIIMLFWNLPIPARTVLVANTFFVSHGLVEDFAPKKQPFIMLSKRDKRDAASHMLVG